MKAILRNVRISPKKANLVAGTVRGKTVAESLALLSFMPKKASKILYKVIHSAASNAKSNFNQSFDDLYVTKILVTKGPTYKRSIPISRGRAHPLLKRTSHITVEVGLKEGTMPSKSKKMVGKEGKMKETTSETTTETTKKPAKKTVAKKKTAIASPKKSAPAKASKKANS